MAVCLNMIVKNECATIERCLELVKPWINHWVIVDTGSTDGTQEIIRRCLSGLPGQLYDRPWINFEHNRNEALALAKEVCGSEDFILFMDADDLLVFTTLPQLDWGKDADCYEIEEHDVNLRFWRPFIVRASLPWQWVGKTHEFLQCSVPGKTAKLTGVYRLRGSKTNEQYKVKLDRDLAILSSSDSDDPRTCFYLAQTLRDLGRLQEALVMYDKRASLAGWYEERWWAQYESAILKERLGREPAEVIHGYLQAFEARPSRSEPLVQLARYCRDKKWYHLSLMFVDQGIQIPFPVTDRLFVDASVYFWKFLDEFAVATYWVGRYEESRDACKNLLAMPDLPPNDRERIEQNLRFANNQLAGTRSN